MKKYETKIKSIQTNSQSIDVGEGYNYFGIVLEITWIQNDIYEVYYERHIERIYGVNYVLLEKDEIK